MNNRNSSEMARVENVKQSALATKLETQIGHHENDLKENKENMATAIKKRDSAREEYNATQKDDLHTITSLKNAIAVLKKHQSLVQDDQTAALRNVALLAQFKMNRKKAP